MISRSLALKLFEGFSIQRWNDMPRPMDLTEMDKAGHKMVVAYLIGKIHEASGGHVDWHKVIYGGVFELLKKIALSDIKASVHRMIKEKHPDEFAKLNEWVVDQYIPLIDDGELIALFREYMLGKDDMGDPSFRILRAAHKYTTLREFEVVRGFSLNTHRILSTERELYEDVCQFLDLRGMQLLVTKLPPYDFMAEMEQLRFQMRWSQTPRVPMTSVLGHSYFVACLSLLVSRDLKPCPRRTYNDFFCGLFHDLPEAVTRDIVRPVKYATSDLPEIVKQVERDLIQDMLVPKMTPCIKEEIMYFICDEFADRAICDGKEIRTKAGEIDKSYNYDDYSPIDGGIIKLCDGIAALLEADQSIAHGITSEHLKAGRSTIIGMYQNKREVCGIDVGPFFREFRS